LASLRICICSVKALAKPASASAAAASASAAATFKIKIFYGSQSGTAEGFARQLKKEAVRYGVAAVVQDLESYTPVPFVLPSHVHAYDEPCYLVAIPHSWSH
jgi:sulfite reductase alpha subunit-like flavoprotein